jgi:hypothetical protein
VSEIYLDAQACPVIEEVFQVARRYALPVHAVCALPMPAPESQLVRVVKLDPPTLPVAEWILTNVKPDDIVVTADRDLADRSLEKGVRVLGPWSWRDPDEPEDTPTPGRTDVSRWRFLRQLSEMVVASRRASQ